MIKFLFTECEFIFTCFDLFLFLIFIVLMFYLLYCFGKINCLRDYIQEDIYLKKSNELEEENRLLNKQVDNLNKKLYSKKIKSRIRK